MNGQRIDSDAVARAVEFAKTVPNWASTWAFDRRWKIGRLGVRADMRRADGLMGRFGGGWNWKLGIQASSPCKYGWTVILSLLVMSVTLTWSAKK